MTNNPIPDVERAVIGALLLCGTPEEGAAVIASAGALRPEDFLSRECGAAWEIGRSLVEAGQLPDPVAVTHALATRTKAGKPQVFVGALLDGLPRVQNVSQWASLIREQAAEDNSAARSEWGPPVPLRTFDPEPFPTECLPRDLRGYVEALACATQTPADLAAFVGLAVVSTACAKRVEVRIKIGWVEPVNIFTAVVLPPGNLKSAVFADATRPLSEFQADEAARLGPEVKKSQARRKVAEKALERAQAEAAKATGAKERVASLAEVARAVEELDGLPVMVAPRLWADDVTPEKLSALMAEQGERMAVLSAEGGVFGLLKGRYTSNGGPNLDVFLKGHAGDRLAVDRIGREPVLIESPALTVGLAVQPEVIRSLADTPEFRGRGLLARFLYAIPRSLVGDRDLDAPHVPMGARRRYDTMIRALLSIAPASQGSRQMAHTLMFSTDAAHALREFRGWIEPQLGEAGDLSLMADWGSKLPGAVARLGGLLHLVGHAHDEAPWATPISGDTMAAAVLVGRYLIPHAQSAFGLMGADPALDDADRVLGWLRRNRVVRFTVRDAMRACRPLRTAEQAQVAMAVLAERGYVRAEERPGRYRAGRPTSDAWAVSPFVLSVTCPTPSKAALGAGGHDEKATSWPSQTRDSGTERTRDSHQGRGREAAAGQPAQVGRPPDRVEGEL